MQSRTLRIQNLNGQELAAKLDLPVDGHPIAYALFAHCFTCSKNLKAVANISRALTHEGIAVLRFDFTGLGQSEGDFADTNFSSNVTDLVASAGYLAENYDAPKILIGHSLGGAAVLQAAKSIPSAIAVVTIGAPAEPRHVAHLLQSKRQEIETKGEAEIVLAGRKFTIKKQFLDDLDATKMEENIHNLRKALLVFHSPFDNTVSVDNAAAIFKAARHPKSYISLDNADHLLTKESDSLYVGEVISAWIRKYIKFPHEEEAPRSIEDNQVVVKTGATGYCTEIMAGGHGVTADEPVSVGGTNRGPSPYDYLVAALGACTSITLRMYADRKKWPVEGITVRLDHQKIHASDCAACESSAGKIDHITREIELSGPLDTDQKQRLMEIADKCPVHRTLHSEIVVETSLKE